LLGRRARIGGSAAGTTVTSNDAVSDLGLTALGIEAWYGQTQALFGVSISVPPKQIVGLFGHNGAGKSTLLRTISGVHRQARGDVRLGSDRLTKLPAHQIARRGLVFVREGAKVFAAVTVEEHLQLAARLARMSGNQPVDLEVVYSEIPILGNFRKRIGSELSGGQRQLVALGMAFVANPRCLMLDEPSTGLAGDALDAIFSLLRSLSAQGVSVLVAEQNPTWLAELVDRAYLLELGRIVAEGELHEILGAGSSGQMGEPHNGD
jgi:branched-chain amino acid transport system ATP-binding protein